MTTITPDPKNANKGTQRGRGLLEKSLRSYGAGRSILVDRNGVIVAGNKTAEVAGELGLPVRIIETDGHELIAVQRTDLDMQDRAAKELAIADNRVSEVSLEWDIDVLESLITDGVDLSAFWHEDELDALLTIYPDSDEWDAAFGSVPDGDKSPFEQMTFTVTADQAEEIRRALTAAKRQGEFVDTGNENSNGNALARVCESYVG